MKTILILVLKFYKKFLSPILILGFGHSCRFTPTCSEYAIKSVEKYGVLKGGALSLKRLARCQPFSSSPWLDPVS